MKRMTIQTQSLVALLALFGGVARAGTPVSAADHSIAGALFRMRLHETSDALRHAWLASGRPEITAAAPAITAGEIRAADVNVLRPPAGVPVTVAYKTSSAGLYTINFQFLSSTTDQAIYFSYTVPAGFLLTRGTVTIEQPDIFSRYAAPGTWTLNQAGICDNSGVCTSYDQSQLSSLFKSLNVTILNSNTPDTVQPTVTGGQILTPTVSLSSPSPLFEATISATDDKSGVSFGNIYFTLPAGDSGSNSSTRLPAPSLNGTLSLSTALQGTAPGTATIYGYGVCDAAGNCFSDFTSADVQTLFGTTTFQVTN